MKRKFLVLLSLILALVLSLTLASCGGSDDDDDDDDSSSDKDSSNDTQEVTSKTWDKYFELDNILHFEIEYSAVTEEDETIEVSYLFDDGFYEYTSDFYGDDYGEDTPNYVLDLPFPSVLSFLKEADADIDFNYKDFEYHFLCVAFEHLLLDTVAKCLDFCLCLFENCLPLFELFDFCCDFVL
ncbi:MAG: hypothetical protein J6B45_03130 [Clostridia bacterium]|nr:hypothetical protein [Clostridia bacterium]